MFTAHHAAVLNSDHVVHKLLQRRDIRDLISRRLGIGKIAANEEGRRMLAEIVFADEKKLDWLEEIIFPLVREVTESWMKTDIVRTAPLAVVELPMLFEAEMTDLFDYVVLITAPAEIRQDRHAGKIPPSDFERRAARQLPEEDKRARADFVFDNSGSQEELDEFVGATVAAVLDA